MPYLLAAEADKIQEFIFRSSRLREVVGGSQLLTRFCRSVEDTLAKDYKAQVVVNDGGSFRVIFDTREQAVAFGADLAELYRLALGGSLTVAEPVALNGDFREAHDRAGNALRWAKNRRQGAMAEPHMPYVAFCASCGVGLANTRGRQTGRRTPQGSQYLCETCQTKTAERDRKPRAMLDEFYRAYCERLEIEPQEDPDWDQDADDIAEFDLRKRNYVAYLVADGNGMGRIFGSCDQGQMTTLSAELTSVLRSSLARAAADFKRTVPGQGDMIPVLPLILGGDDLFALIPAPYALDFARRFCLAWEEQMDELVKKVGLTDVPPPTVAAAVVICKSKYPYALAHRRAEELLKAAKRQCKQLATEKGEHLSAVNFEVILGNRLAGLQEENEQSNGDVRSTLRPYWVTNNGLPASAQERGVELKQLLDQRLALKNVPNKRLMELRRCFENLPADIKFEKRREKMEEWNKHELRRILDRLGQSTRARSHQPSKSLRDQVDKAFVALGKPENEGNGAHHWRSIERDGTILLAHGMLDLLEAWDFAQDLGHSPDEYEPQEEEA